MDKNEKLGTLVNNIIDDKPEEAQIAFHQYIRDKMQAALGISNPTAVDTQGTQNTTQKKG